MPLNECFPKVKITISGKNNHSKLKKIGPIFETSPNKSNPAKTNIIKINTGIKFFIDKNERIFFSFSIGLNLPG